MNCPKCNTMLLPNTNFCPNCGFQITTIVQTVGMGKQIWIYFVSLVLPPLGLAWTFKYMRSPESQKKRIALIAAILTVISIIVTLWLSVGLLQGIQQQLNSYQNLGL